MNRAEPKSLLALASGRAEANQGPLGIEARTHQAESLPDPDEFFYAGLDGNARRAINFSREIRLMSVL
jgi:hypothetical protein